MTSKQWHIARGDFAKARTARHEFVQLLLENCRADSDITAAELVFGELVTNAVRHAANVASVTLSLGATAGLRVAEDGTDSWAGVVRPAEASATGGRGLYIVSLLANDLRFEDLEPGLAVSVVLPVRPRS
jgi:anti-sigma regulatory factor (Ser/Thr protein kinase)